MKSLRNCSINLRERENRRMKYSEMLILFTKSSCNNNVNSSHLSDEIHFPNPTKNITVKNDDGIVVHSIEKCRLLPSWPCHEEHGRCGTGQGPCHLSCYYIEEAQINLFDICGLEGCKTGIRYCAVVNGGSRMRAQPHRVSYLVVVPRTPKNQINP